MNSRTKGRNAENEAKDILEKSGWAVIQAPGSFKFNKQVDLLGNNFDLVCIKKSKRKSLGETTITDSLNTKIRCIQVKCNRTAGSIKKIKAALRDETSPIFFMDSFENISFEVWVRKDGAGGRKPEWQIKKVGI